MAAPTISSATLNKVSYAKGDTMILTVVGSDADEAAVEVTVTLKNTASGGQSAPVTVTAVVDDLVAVCTDTSGRIWTQTSRTGSTFVLTATA